MQYLKDGNYLDDKSRGLTAEMLTYNAHLEVLGFSRMRFEWQANGVITGKGAAQDLFRALDACAIASRVQQVRC